MANYRARICPSCGFFIGFSISKPLSGCSDSAITSFCLNCSYKLPVHTVAHGTRRNASRPRRAMLKLISKVQPDRYGLSPGHDSACAESPASGTIISTEDYSRHLRTLGQQLQRRCIDTFNLQCTGAAYRIWTREKIATPSNHFFGKFSACRLEKWWEFKNDASVNEPVTIERFCRRQEYSLEDLGQLENAARRDRNLTSGFADGHSLSQLLRTIGCWVHQRNHRLLAISWRDLSVCVVVQTAQGRRELDVFRPDNLYDLWVGMYLRRNDRVLSDAPR